MVSELPPLSCPECGLRFHTQAGVENCLADHEADREVRSVPKELHTQFTCTELEDLLTSAAELWNGECTLDYINDANVPELVDLWERLGREHERLTREEYDRTGNDIRRSSRLAG